MKQTLIILILLSYNCLYSQSTPDYEKMSKVCELWGLVKYFHTDNPGNKFDSAFAAAVPKMLEARNENDWRILLTQWLNVLNDQNTRVVSGEEKITGEGHLKTEFAPDSTLIIKISGTSQLSDFNKTGNFFQNVKEQLNKAKRGIIFDLRQEAKIPEYEGYLTYYFEDLNSVLATEIVPHSRVNIIRVLNLKKAPLLEDIQSMKYFRMPVSQVILKREIKK